jgi:Zn-dependent protease
MRERGEALVAFAGPLSNLVIALIFGLFMRFSSLDVESPAFKLSALIVLINLILALFNLMPIPPLDGSKILGVLLPPRYQHIRQKIENFGFVAVLLFALLLWQFVLIFSLRCLQDMGFSSLVDFLIYIASICFVPFPPPGHQAQASKAFLGTMLLFSKFHNQWRMNREAFFVSNCLLHYFVGMV